MYLKILHASALFVLSTITALFSYELYIANKQDHQKVNEKLWKLDKLHTQQYQNILEIRSSLAAHFGQVKETREQIEAIVSEIMNPVNVGNTTRFFDVLSFSKYNANVASQLNAEFHDQFNLYEKMLANEFLLIDRFRIMFSILEKTSREVTVLGIELEHSMKSKVVVERIHSIIALINDKLLHYYATGDHSVIIKAASYIEELKNINVTLSPQSTISLKSFIRNLTVMLKQIQLVQQDMRKLLDGEVLKQITKIRALNKQCAEIVAFELKVLYIGLFLSILFLIVYGGVLIALVLSNARRRALSADQIRSEFLTSVSHEIRTPMNGIIGMTELLLEEDLTERQRTRARVISNAADNLMNIINDILNFSEIEAGELDLEPITFNLREYVEDVSELFGRRAAQKNIELILRYHPKLPEFMIGDPVRIGQIISNLVSNAVKFTKEGYVLINVEPEEVLDGDENSVRVKVSIEDTGIGISKDKQQYIFEHFTQGDGSYTREFAGTGIGLAICQKLVTALSGEIGMESSTGVGSHFWFIIEMGVGRRESVNKLDIQEDLQETKIMVIDDLSVNRKVLQEQLFADYMNVTAYGKVSMALDVMKDAARDGEPFDVMLVDHSMPEKNGLEFAKEVNNEETLSHTAVVLLTDEDQNFIKNECKEAGIVACLRKPVRHSDLLDAISLIQNSRAQDRTMEIITPDILESRRSHELPVSVSETITFDHMDVLLVEDNQVNQMLAEEMLLDLGCSVSIAENGLVAVEQMEEKAFDLVFMDCQMPVMDGFEATQKILKLQKQGIASEAPIIALTANALKGDREKCLDAGMSDYVAKPICKNILRDILIKWTPDGKKVRSEYLELTEMWEDDTQEDIETQPAIQPEAEITKVEFDVYDINMEELEQVREMLKGRFSIIVEGYLEDAKVYLRTIEEGMEERDLEKIAASAHTLKSSSASLGLKGASELSKIIEETAKESGNFEEIQLYIPELVQAVEYAEPKLRALLNTAA